MNTAMQELWDYIDANYHEEGFNLYDAKELSLEKEKEQIINFHKWMLKNDTAENADKYFHYSDDDMFNEYLKTNKLYGK
jgi:hypothetical protein